jgi:hypothetical protein
MTDVQEPSKTNKPVFEKSIAKKILIELDGWQIATKKDIEKESVDVEPFLDPENPEEMRNIKTNHKVSMGEIKHFYDTAFQEALSYTNRHDIDDLDGMLKEVFMNGVIKLTASNLWIKYNTSVTVNNEEGIIDYGQGGKLYKKYLGIMEHFIKGVRIEISAI